MMVVDTSALAAIIRLETEATQMHEAIARNDPVLIPASVVVELALLRKLGPNRMKWLRTFVQEGDLKTAAVDSEVADIAADAAERYGRGSGHPARLNFGDCLSYAVAKHFQAPLLYKGNDFTYTDIESALPA
jgi:ribonuclease VapC